MSDKQPNMPFNNVQTWNQKVLEADKIYAQVQKVLESTGKELPQTLRRPDIRLILENTSGEELKFLNPGDHSKEQPEIIPAEGDKAVMVMLKGDTLHEQLDNARKLDKAFNLSDKGLTREFAHALGTDKTSDMVDEAYGPAPFEGQSEKLVSLDWQAQDAEHVEIEPVKSNVCAYGARAATKETVFSSEVVIYVKGTHTIPECVEGTAMCVAVSSDWQTGEISTRPIVPSVAQEFYGAHYKDIPVVTVSPEGDVQSIDLKNGGDVIKVDPPKPDYTQQSYNISGMHISVSFDL